MCLVLDETMSTCRSSILVDVFVGKKRHRIILFHSSTLCEQQLSSSVSDWVFTRQNTNMTPLVYFQALHVEDFAASYAEDLFLIRAAPLCLVSWRWMYFSGSYLSLWSLAAFRLSRTLWQQICIGSMVMTNHLWTRHYQILFVIDFLHSESWGMFWPCFFRCFSLWTVSHYNGESQTTNILGQEGVR